MHYNCCCTISYSLSWLTKLILCFIHRRTISSKRATEFSVSANMAYGQVKLEPLGGGEGDVYEDPEEMVESGRGNDGYSAEHEYEATRPAETTTAAGCT